MDNKKLNTLFGHISDEAMETGKIEMNERSKRKSDSLFDCRIPDWTGNGGMVDFWINDDGTFESEDSRIDDDKISVSAYLRGLKRLKRKSPQTGAFALVLSHKIITSFQSTAAV